jgi:hypothetical protein
VTSGIPQGSVLGPILFVLYINDMPEVTSVGTHTYLFADDTKAFRGIFQQSDCVGLQMDLTYSKCGLTKAVYNSLNVVQPMYSIVLRRTPIIELALLIFSEICWLNVNLLSITTPISKQIPGISSLSYEDRLRKLKLPTLAYKRSRGDMIEL